MKRPSAVSAGQRLLLGALIAGVLPGCGDPTAPPSTGSLDVTITTSGALTEPDSVEVVIDSQAQAWVMGGHAVITGIATGRHSIKLGGVAPACNVTTDNPLAVDIRAGASTSVEFAVRCLDKATITVSVATQGANNPRALS
jgi:VCBS repeat-containing protein